MYGYGSKDNDQLTVSDPRVIDSAMEPWLMQPSIATRHRSTHLALLPLFPPVICGIPGTGGLWAFVKARVGGS